MKRGLGFGAVLVVALALGIIVFHRLSKRESRPAPVVTAPPKVVLHSALAGSWYEADPQRLASELEGYLDEAEQLPLGTVRALILPHAGYRWSGRVAASGLKQVAGREFERVVVLGPSHAGWLDNLASIPLATHYATPLGEVALDLEFIRRLRCHRRFIHFPDAHAREHSVQIHVPLLQAALGEFRLVPIVVGRLELETSRGMARILSALIDDDTLVIASTDFTHFGDRFDYFPFRDDVPERLKALDLGAFARIVERSDEAFARYIEETGATICGRAAVGVLLGMLGPESRVHLVEYATSGEMTGSYRNSVSYLSAAVTGALAKADLPEPPGPRLALTPEHGRLLLALAETTLRHVLRTGEQPTAEALGFDIPDALRWPSGVFVTIYKGASMRGCRGYVRARAPLYLAVMQSVVASALQDKRFRPVRSFELPDLRYQISVLTEPVPVDSYEEIVLGRHGIVLEKDGRSALYLPHVAPEQGWRLEETLDHLAQKAGLPADAWKQGASFQVFEAEVFTEAEG